VVESTLTASKDKIHTMNTLDRTTKRILVVEDDVSIGNMCQRVLTREGFEVEIALNAGLARDMIEKNEYHVCLVDIRTPQMTGVELYQWLQQKHPHMANRVIFTTGSLIGEDTQSFIWQSGRPFLPKPFTPDELTEIIEKSLRKR
jgi:DNA-binding NtrC family response regulator